MKVGLLIVATGKYIRYVRPLTDSLDRFFLTGHEKTYYLFTDHVPGDFDHDPRFVVTHIQRRGYPHDSMYRYRYFLMREADLREKTDVLYYIDADMLIVDSVGDEILPTDDRPLVGTIHPGFYPSRWGSPETRPISTAYIAPNESRPHYWCGGFNGGKTDAFLDMAKRIDENIATDEAKGVQAVWVDESHLNRYFVTHQNRVKSLTPTYCYPQSWNLGGLAKKIVALDKNHAEVRSQ